MASTADLIKSGIAQAASGKELDSNTIEMDSGGDMSPATEDVETDHHAENSTLEDLLPGDGEDTPPDSSEQDSAEAKAEKAPEKKTSTEKEVITVTDADGRRRKVEIDYGNREAIKKAHLMAAGARKWQAERDQAIQRLKSKDGEIAEVKKNWNDLDSAYQNGGIEGLFDLLEGKGAFKSYVASQVKRAKFLETASPEEVEQLKLREELEATKRDAERTRKDNEKFKQEITTERETAEMRALEARVNPVFNRYSFSGKLGDATDEHMFDEMLWNTAMKRLEPYEEQGLDITPALIEKEFATVARSIRKRIGAQAEKKAQKVVEQKKQEATENVQAKVQSGYKTGGAAKEARDLIQSGNLTGLLKGWNKYGGLFQKK